MGSGALLLLLGSVLAIAQIIGYQTTDLDDAASLAIIGIYALVTVAFAILAFPEIYVPSAAAVILGVLLCGTALFLALPDVVSSRPIDNLAFAPLAITGVASLVLGAILGRVDRRMNRSIPRPIAWWRVLLLTLAITGDVGLGLFLVAIINAGSILVFGAAISWLLALVGAVAAGRGPRRA
jgi:hypothetical protein